MSPTATATALVPAPETVVAPAAAAAAAPVPDFDILLTSIQSIIAAAKDLQQDLKKVQRVYAKLIKSRKTKKVKAAGEGAAPSGFAKPTAISQALADFLQVDKDVKLPRTEVTRMLNKYIKDNGLQKPEDRRIILPDAKLKALLQTEPSDSVVSFFNIQGFLKKHFIKTD